MTREEKWNYNYALLEKYYLEHGNIDIPQNYKVDDINLGIWLKNQRVAYREKGKGIIDKDQILKLEKLGIKWRINTKISWDDFYELLLTYKSMHGNIDVPQNYKMNGISLGAWLNNQREAYRGKNTCKLTKEKIDKLNKLGIKWNKCVDNWEENYKLLEEYYFKYGNIDVPTIYKVKEINLGVWLNTQRVLYKAFKLPKEKIDKLNKLGIKWSVYITWEEYYILLKEYKEKYGSINIPYHYQINGVNLGIWLHNQRLAYNLNKIGEKRIILLNLLGMDWSIKDTKLLNSTITNMDIYNITLFKRTNLVLRDLALENTNKIYSKDAQKEIEKQLIKRIWS